MKRRQSAVLLVMVFVISLFTGCSATVKADISEYKDSEITIAGLTEEEFTVTPEELSQLKCKKKTLSTTSKGRKVTQNAIGPTLETFLENYGYSLDDIEEVIFVASDGYTKSYDSDFFLVHDEIILSVASGNDPLEEEDQPVRLAIEDVMPDNWVKGVVRIQFIL